MIRQKSLAVGPDFHADDKAIQAYAKRVGRGQITEDNMAEVMTAGDGGGEHVLAKDLLYHSAAQISKGYVGTRPHVKKVSEQLTEEVRNKIAPLGWNPLWLGKSWAWGDQQSRNDPRRIVCLSQSLDLMDTIKW